MALTTSTAKKLKEAILALLSGSSEEINKKTGEYVPNNKTTDPFKRNPIDNAPTYNDEFSVAKHITSKQKTITYPSKGMKQTFDVEADEVTQLPKYKIKDSNQPERPLGESSNEGAIENQELDEENAKVPVPTDFSNDQYLQTIVNSLSVSIANSIAEAVTNIIIAKIEENQTEIEIEWDSNQHHQIQNVGLQGLVVPGQTGGVQANLGEITFKNGIKYKHKCKIKFSDL